MSKVYLKHLAGQPAGEARSMGIHESQSLFFEMQVGRSDPFTGHLANLAGQQFSGSEFEQKITSRRSTLE